MAAKNWPLTSRFVIATTAYIASAIVVLVVVFLVRHNLPPPSLRTFLSYLLISTVSAGLEPGTVKSAAIRAGSTDPLPSGGVAATASLLKALAASPILALVWRFSDPAIGWAALMLMPLICWAGFAATDIRVLLDLRGRHAAATALKQGSTSMGVLITGGLMMAGAPPAWAIVAATLARLALLILPVNDGAFTAVPWPQAARLIGDWRWLEFAGASALSASGGSIDRMIGLRIIAPEALGSYVLIFEIFSRFWLIPYLLAPIVFARRLRGDTDGRFMRVAQIVTATAGGTLFAGLGAVALVAPHLFQGLTGHPLDGATFALAGAVVIASFAQLRVAELQALGASRRVLAQLFFGLVMSVAAFTLGAHLLGVQGLMWAWLAKAIFELAMAYSGGPRGSGRSTAPSPSANAAQVESPERR